MNNLKEGTLLQGELEYRIVKQLGHGGFGITYLAEATFLFKNIPQKGKFCIKEFFLSERCSREESGWVNFNTDKKTEENGKSDFKAEAKTLKSLNAVPGIVPVSEIIEANNTVYYVMQYLEGETLDKKIRAEERLDEKESLSIIERVGKALCVLHDKRMTHLDVKPENIMLVGEGCEVQPVLIDFGLSRSYNLFGREVNGKKVFAISEGYSPVEQYGILNGFTPEADVYALAATLFHMLTGEMPKPSDKVTDEYVRETMKSNGVSKDTINAISCAMQKEKDYRTGTVNRFMADLGLRSPNHNNVEHKTKPIIKTPKPPVPPVPPKKKYYILAAVVALVAVLFYLLLPKDEPYDFKDNDEAISESVSEEGNSHAEMDQVSSAVEQSPQSKQTFTVNGISFTMVHVEGGTFTMGATSEQGNDAESDEKPAHQVTLSAYSIGETEVTQELWQAVMGSNPSNFKGAKRPVEEVSWNDCQDFIKKLNAATGRKFRLPTEAEWEYAARGGNRSKGYKYAGSNSIEAVAWYTNNSYDKGSSSPDYGTHVVATKQPNELGIYDMSGNVCEWCQDCYGKDYYSNSSQTNPKGPNSGQYRVYRGGSWGSYARNCRSSNRNSYDPGIWYYILGLRLVLSE